MGSVYRKTVTKALPAGAQVFTRQGERFARWRDAKGKARTAAVTIGRDGAERIVVEAVAVATGTADFRPRQFAPGFAPSECKLVQTGTFAVKTTGDAKSDPRHDRLGVCSCPDERNDPLTSPVNESRREPPIGVEPITSALRTTLERSCNRRKSKPSNRIARV
jgi:hypothetical protein